MRDVEKLADPRAEAGHHKPARLAARIYGIMALTMVLTFATLEAGHQLFFPPQQLFA